MDGLKSDNPGLFGLKSEGGVLNKKKRKFPYMLFGVFIVAVAVWMFFARDQYGLSPIDNIEDFFTQQDWVGWIHPFGKQGRVLQVGPFDSLESCRGYSFHHLQREYEEWASAEYYCGYSCEDANHKVREEYCKVVRK